MVQFQSYNKIIISKEDGIKNFLINGHIMGFELKCQYPSYRGTYLSCIEKFELYVDGEKVDDSKINFIINGKSFLISQLKDLYSEYWFILDKATLRVYQEGGLKQGKHNVKVIIKHRIPYTGYFGTYMVLVGEDSKELEVFNGGVQNEERS